MFRLPSQLTIHSTEAIWMVGALDWTVPVRDPLELMEVREDSVEAREDSEEAREELLGTKETQEWT